MARKKADMKTRRVPGYRMEHLRAWRESLGLSRANVALSILTLLHDDALFDQATVAKWESGESRVTVEDLQLLAKVYGTTADRLFFPPGDALTPELLGAAHQIITTRDPAAVRAWLASGGFLPEAEKKSD